MVHSFKVIFIYVCVYIYIYAYIFWSLFLNNDFHYYCSFFPSHSQKKSQNSTATNNIIREFYITKIIVFPKIRYGNAWGLYMRVFWTTICQFLDLSFCYQEKQYFFFSVFWTVFSFQTLHSLIEAMNRVWSSHLVAKTLASYTPRFHMDADLYPGCSRVSALMWDN